MNTYQISKLLSKCKYFGGTYPSDKIPKNYKTPIIFIVNTDPVKEEGEHWTALAISADVSALYFCPFGFPPLAPDLLHFIEENCKRSVVYSKASLQHTSSSNCGIYCIDFVIKISKRWSYERFLNQFSTDTENNDRLILAVYKAVINES